ncbi:MAG: hypothetical protein D6753_16415, partial [Planctomycetota bacterium]
MGRPKRSDLWKPDEIAVLHCVQRCGRGAFLAGIDPTTGRDYSSRRDRLRDRLRALVSVFGIEVVAFAIMPDHFHVMVRTRPDRVARWTDLEAAVRWLQAFPGRRDARQLGTSTEQTAQALAADPARLARVRERLADVSWFMRSISEPIARAANREDGTRGAFWEGRFKAQRITDPFGALATALYVDLNPVRAGLVPPPHAYPGTGAYERFQEGPSGPSGDARATAGRKSPQTAYEPTNATPASEPAWLAPVITEHEMRPPAASLNSKSIAPQRASEASILPLPHLTTAGYLPILSWVAAEGAVARSHPCPDALRRMLAEWDIRPDVLR